MVILNIKVVSSKITRLVVMIGDLPALTKHKVLILFRHINQAICYHTGSVILSPEILIQVLCGRAAVVMFCW